MDVLQLEIQIAKDELARAVTYHGTTRLEVGEIVLHGSEIDEVLATVQNVLTRRLNALEQQQGEPT